MNFGLNLYKRIVSDSFTGIRSLINQNESLYFHTDTYCRYMGLHGLVISHDHIKEAFTP